MVFQQNTIKQLKNTNNMEIANANVDRYATSEIETLSPNKLLLLSGVSACVPGYKTRI